MFLEIQSADKPMTKVPISKYCLFDKLSLRIINESKAVTIISNDHIGSTIAIFPLLNASKSKILRKKGLLNLMMK